MPSQHSRNHHQPHLQEKGCYPAARSRKEKCADGNEGQYHQQGHAVTILRSQQKNRKACGDDQFNQSCKVIAIYIGPEGNSSVSQLAKPVQLSVEGEVLQDAEHRYGKSHCQQEPREANPMLQGLERLHREEKYKQQGSQLEDLELCQKLDGR